eukprot:GFKZ01002881.1.p1 GENE.GFKZ01002881.1~~GFKZ01002881.1.p1  ORF type:complete len:434 (-),score=30.92 GFKZ01002881.1:437-1738(-)
MAWFTVLHRLFLSACSLIHPSPRRDPPTHCTPVSVQPVSTSTLYTETSHSPAPHSASSTPSKPLNLLALPDDILHEIVTYVTHSFHDSPAQGSLLVVEERSYIDAIALTETCTTLRRHFNAALDNVCFSSARVSDAVITSLAMRSAPVLKGLVLRGCEQLTDVSLASLAQHAHSLRALDLSFVNGVTDCGVAILCKATAQRLRKLLLRKCTGVGDVAMTGVAHCENLETLDISYCVNITDAGVTAVAKGCGQSLRLLAMSYNVRVGDVGLIALGEWCKGLIQLCARGLPKVSDLGFRKLCQGLGDSVEGIDVTDCTSLTRDSTLCALRSYCGKIYAHVMPGFSGKSLRQILVSTLRQNIFIVHGSDPNTGRDTVHTVLIDNGDIVSASLLSSGTTDLSKLGIVLCKSYGTALDDCTKMMLESDYGIPTGSLAD